MQGAWGKCRDSGERIRMIKYLLGSKEDFWKFIDSISKEDKVGIISHTDLDGVASVLFLEMILNSKGINFDFFSFKDYKLGMFDDVFPELEKNKITKIFITDINADGTDAEGFKKLRDNFDVFVIDHHLLVDSNAKNVIKTQTTDCVAYTIFDLGKEIIDEKKWKFLLYSTMISDMSYKNPDNLEFIRKDYPDVNEDNILCSEPGELAKTIGGALIYFVSLEKDLKEVYDLVKKQEFVKLKKYNNEVQKEIDFYLNKLKKEAEYYPEKDLYFYYFNPKFNITSFVSTIFSFEHKDSTLIIISDTDEDSVKVSARNQNKKQDMCALLKKGIHGLKHAAAGGHIPAAGGNFLKKDLKKFKENILK